MSRTTDSQLPNWSSRLASELDAADRRAELLAAGLPAAALNWQPQPGAWSAAQCLDHLRKVNDAILSAISDALKNQPQHPVDEIVLGRPTRWFIRNYVAPNPGGARARATKNIEPGAQFGPDILDAFLQSTQAARTAMRQARSYDVNRIRYKNPFVPLLRFTVGAGFEIIAKHAARHLLQAENVTRSAGFPR